MNTYERDKREADIAARAVEPRKEFDPRKTETSLLIMMLNAEQCMLVLWGEDLEHMPDVEKDAKAELQCAMSEVAREIDRRIPIPEGP